MTTGDVTPTSAPLAPSTLLGTDGAGMCVDGVCALPGEARTVEQPQGSAPLS